MSAIAGFGSGVGGTSNLDAGGSGAVPGSTSSSETGGHFASGGASSETSEIAIGGVSGNAQTGGSAGFGSSNVGGTVPVGGQSNGGGSSFAGSLGLGGATRDPCALVDCRRHSHCVVGSNDLGTCACDSGYVQDGLQCYSTSAIVDVAAGDAHSCAVRSDGTVGCWGWNMDGALGDGGVVDESPVPLLVPNVTNAIAIGAGGHASCALLSNHTIKCWGFLGGGRAEPSPVLIEGLSNVASLAVGGPTSCAVLDDGSAYCWGVLSPTDSIVSIAPIKVSRDEGPAVRSVFAGYGRIWAILADDTVHVLADSGNVLDEESLLESASRFSVGVYGKAPPCVVMLDGSVRCAEANNSGVGAPWSFTVESGYSDVVGLGRGTGFRCAVRGDGGVLCSGSNTYGELCDGTFINREDPSPAVGLENTTRIAASWFHGCALDQGGKLRCWGMNAHGALGDGRDEFPIEIPELTDATQICLGHESACVVDASSRLRCWGNGYASSSPADWLSGVRSCAGGSSACAVMLDDTVQCWGSNDQGQLGDGTKADRSSPTPVLGLTRVSQIATGTHSCAVRLDGTLYCWGRNDLNQVGDGTTNERLTPVAVPGISTAMTVAVGTNHSCAALRDGTVRCWGDNTRGQLGNGTTVADSGVVVALGLADIVRLDILGDVTLALNRRGDAYRWGGWSSASNGSETETIVDHTPHPWNAPSQIAEVASSSCVRLLSGEVQCNFTGTWSRVIGWGETKSLAVESGLTCAITKGNRVICNGVGWNGELGDSYPRHRPWPELVASW